MQQKVNPLLNKSSGHPSVSTGGVYPPASAAEAHNAKTRKERSDGPAVTTGELRARKKDKDWELVAQCKKGDEKAYKILFDNYRQRVFRLLYRYAGNTHDAMDLVQTTFIKAFRSLDRFRSEAMFSTWLFRIAANVGIDHTRRRKGDKLRGLNEANELEEAAWRSAPDHNPFEPTRLLEQKELQASILKAVEDLPETQRMAFTLHAMEGMRYHQIAEVMDCSIGTVMSRLYYARRKLQEALSGEMAG